jgi:FtsH-binding integral membrane protein
VLASLLVPIVLSAVVLFFASFLSWMILQLHKDDWRRLDREDEFLAAVRPFNLPEGSYMFPRPVTQADMKTEAFQAKYKAGPRGVMTILPPVNMGVNLAMTMAYFLVVSLILGYLASVAFPTPGASFLNVFRFVFTAGLLGFLASVVQHSIWFRNRIVGHVFESILYAAIVGVIFASMWPDK